MLSCLWLAACAGPGATARGPEWDVVQVWPGASLRACSAPGGDVVWCSGTKGLVLRSVDGGRRFEAVGPAGCQDLDFRSLVAFDADRAVVANAGAPARVYRTADGGLSWSLVHEDLRAEAFFDALAFADERRGYLLGDPIAGAVQLFATDDGGATWHPVEGLPMAVDGEAMFAASCSCLLAKGDEVVFATGGAMSRVFRSRDRARTWSLSLLPLQQGKPSQGAFALAAHGEGEFVAVGGDYSEPALAELCAAFTEAAGTVWRSSQGLAGYHSGVTAHAASHSIVAVGPRGAVVSRDGGATFEPFGDTGFHAVTSSGDHVFAVGADGRFGRARP